MEQYVQGNARRLSWQTVLKRVFQSIGVLVCTVAGAAALVYAYGQFAQQAISAYQVDLRDEFQFIRFMLFLPFVAVASSWCFFGWRRTNEWLHYGRFVIGAAVVAIVVILNVNGSSMGIWSEILRSNVSQDVVMGLSRLERTDEYMVGTPFAYSQAYNDYGYFNSIIGNHPSDMFLIKDAPIASAVSIFRPFQWGYLLWGSARGLAFYWSARLVSLFLVAYQFFLMIADDGSEQGKEHRGLALLGAVLISCAPMVQWWFAVNNIVEMLVGAMLSLVMLSQYCKDRSSIRRAIYAIVIMMCAGMFIFSFYPAWQVPLAYVLLAVAIWQIAVHWGHIGMRKRDWVVLVLVVGVFVELCHQVMEQSWPTIQATLNTVYPGDRQSAGGGVPVNWLFSAVSGLAFPFSVFAPSPHSNGINSVEASGFIDFFPLGLLLALVVLIRRKGRDLLSILLIVVCLFLGVYALFEIPQELAKVTLMSFSTGRRALFGFGIVNIVLLIRALALKDWKIPIWLVVPIAALYAFAVVQVTQYTHSNYLGTSWLIIMGVFLFLGAYAFIGSQKHTVAVSMACVVAIVMGTGLIVNPIRYGDAPLTQQPTVRRVSEIQQDDPGVWITVGGSGYQVAQLLVANGIPTVNALAVTPNMDMWEKIDPEGKFESVYNRYAFSNVHVVPKDSDFNVAVTTADSLDVSLSVNQLVKLGVRYALSSEPLGYYDSKRYHFEPLGKPVNGMTVYEIVDVE